MKECVCVSLNKSSLQVSVGNLHVILSCKVCVHKAMGPLSLSTDIDTEGCESRKWLGEDVYLKVNHAFQA